MLRGRRNLPARLGQIFSKIHQVIRPLVGWAGQSTVEARLLCRTKPELVSRPEAASSITRFLPPLCSITKRRIRRKGRCSDKRSSQPNSGVQKPQASSFSLASRETSSSSQGRIWDIRTSGSRSPLRKVSSKLWKGTCLGAQRPHDGR